MKNEKTLQSHETAETAAGYVDAIVKHDAEIAAKPAKPFRVRRSLAPVLGALFPILVGLSAFNIYAAGNTPAAFTPAEEDAAVYFAIIVAQQELNAYRDSTGILPGSLDVVGLDDLGVQYVQLGSEYELRASVGDSTIIYRQGGDLTAIETAFESLAELSR